MFKQNISRVEVLCNYGRHLGKPWLADINHVMRLFFGEHPITVIHIVLLFMILSCTLLLLDGRHQRK